MNQPASDQASHQFEVIGGALCLDFVNTGSARRNGPFKERLSGYQDLAAWSEQVGLMTPAQADELRGAAEDRAGDADEVLARGRELREVIYRVFSGLVEGQSPSGPDLDVLSREHARAAPYRKLTCDSERVELEWDRSPENLDQMLWPVTQSAIELLVSDDLARVKECATDNCNWLFLDASKNRSRRWCEMRECGNRAKARRHYARRKQTE